MSPSRSGFVTIDSIVIIEEVGTNSKIELKYLYVPIDKILKARRSSASCESMVEYVLKSLDKSVELKLFDEFRLKRNENNPAVCEN